MLKQTYGKQAGQELSKKKPGKFAGLLSRRETTAQRQSTERWFIAAERPSFIVYTTFLV